MAGAAPDVVVVDRLRSSRPPHPHECALCRQLRRGQGQEARRLHQVCGRGARHRAGVRSRADHRGRQGLLGRHPAHQAGTAARAARHGDRRRLPRRRRQPFHHPGSRLAGRHARVRARLLRAARSADRRGHQLGQLGRARLLGAGQVRRHRLPVAQGRPLGEHRLRHPHLGRAALPRRRSPQRTLPRLLRSRDPDAALRERLAPRRVRPTRQGVRRDGAARAARLPRRRPLAARRRHHPLRRRRHRQRRHGPLPLGRAHRPHVARLAEARRRVRHPARPARREAAQRQRHPRRGTAARPRRLEPAQAGSDRPARPLVRHLRRARLRPALRALPALRVRR
mmetsp:Transcript_44732/g.95142  ORF Transcript_44732/g.95142 Transcript_44732/m.95142 type:complete len:339 (-) Transcript_44732:789-1805(-)